VPKVGKINKLEKTTDESTYYCITQVSNRCKNKHGILSAGDFYSTSNTDIFVNGKTPICKECIKQYIYGLNGDLDLNKFKKVLMLIDYPFYQVEFESALKDNKETIGIYLKNVQLNHKGQTWADGEHDYNKTIINNEIVEEEQNQIDNKLIMFWGNGFSFDDYNFLEFELSNWKSTHKCDNRAEETLLKEICTKILEIRKLREQGSSVSKEQKELQELMKTASVDPAKANVASAGKSVDAFGVWVKDIETKNPAEWWEDQEKYKDMDGFLPYIKKYIVRPIKNFFTGSKDFDTDAIDSQNEEPEDGDE
jgi:hypothetical protein